MSAAGVQSARSNSSPVSWLRRCVASSKRRFIRSCNTIKSCNGFHCCDIASLSVLLGFSLRLTWTSTCNLKQPHTPSCGRIRRVSLEFHLVAVRRDAHGLTRQDLALQQFHCQRVLNQRLNRALEWSRTVRRIVTFAHQQLPR